MRLTLESTISLAHRYADIAAEQRKTADTARAAQLEFIAVITVSIGNIEYMAQLIRHIAIHQKGDTFRTSVYIPTELVPYNLGFYDEYHFSKQFKKIIGISPRNYRKQQL